jgi:transcriptional regulator with XRE-family HTH domain
MAHRQRPTSSKSPARGDGPRVALPDRIRGILLTKNLTLYKVSVLTRAHCQPSYRIPRNLYFQLRLGLSPTLHQLLAFSELSGYRLADWLTVFGFRLDEIPRLQAALDVPRTTLLDNHLYDARATIPWFRDRSTGGVTPPVAPLSQLLESFGSRRASALLAAGASPYLYAKIGRQDAFAFPDLAPGSIVRANPRIVERLLPRPGGEISKAIFLVEFSRGLCCCRLHFGAKNRVTLTATELPFANVELHLGSEARILGVVDMELRPSANHRRSGIPRCALPEVAPDLARLWTPLPLGQRVGAQRPDLLLRSARLRAGLSLRRASEMSRAVATALHDQRYFTSPGSLSDYEANRAPPHHIHKLFTICVLYSIPFRELVNSFGLGLDESPAAPIPDEWMDPEEWPAPESQATTTRERGPTSGFVATLLGRFGDVPLFLRHSLASLSGLPEISLRDVFWVGGHQKPLHPSLAGALFVIVNRRKRTPHMFRRKSAWEQPLYLLVRRDGSYLLASCSLEDKAIVMHPYTESFVRPERLRDGVDAEVVGQIVTVIRSLLSPP